MAGLRLPASAAVARPRPPISSVRLLVENLTTRARAPPTFGGAMAHSIADPRIPRRPDMRTSGPPKVYRGSRKRVRQIRMRGNWSVELWMLVAVILFILFVILPWLVRHPPPDHEQHTGDPPAAWRRFRHGDRYKYGDSGYQPQGPFTLRNGTSTPQNKPFVRYRSLLHEEPATVR